MPTNALPHPSRRTFLLRWLRRLGLAILVLLALWAVGSELWYRKLLDRPNPPSPPKQRHPAALRQACWSALGESGTPRMQPWAMGMLPFQFGWVAIQTTYSHPRQIPQTPGFRAASRLTRNWDLGYGFSRRVAYTVWVTRHWTAEQTLDGVLDQAWFGVPGAHGATASSQALFGEPVDSLDNRQVAILGLLYQSPHLLCNPRSESAEALARKIERGSRFAPADRPADSTIIGLMDSLPVCKERNLEPSVQGSSGENK